MNSFKSRFNTEMNYEMNSYRSQKYGTSFFVGLDISKTNEDEENYSSSKCDNLYNRISLGSVKEFLPTKPIHRYSQYSPSIEDVAYSVKRDLIKNYKESLNKQLDNFELLSTDFHENLSKSSKPKEKQVEFDFKTFRYFKFY
jgi:hypothetical protein